uniref:PA domain-containing protein n=1 Tax=Otus sunia TaxID=257818 RepID=A0A8C8AVT1_9STRI
MAGELTQLTQSSINRVQVGLVPRVAECSANINSTARRGLGHGWAPGAGAAGLGAAGGSAPSRGGGRTGPLVLCWLRALGQTGGVTHCAGRKWRGVTHPSWVRCGGGLYGLDSPLQAAAGVLVLPDGRDSFNACSARTNFSGAPPPGGGSPGWLALIQRGGGCSFADKIRLAAERGAAAAVIYNYRE